MPYPNSEKRSLDTSTKLFNVVLIEPEIPNNTGNIGRSCIGAASSLHLVGKLGFEIDDKKLRRAGLDYWVHLDWQHHKNLDEWLSIVPDKSRIHLFTTKTTKPIFQAELKKGDWLVFGKETKGLPEDLIRRNLETCIKMPMTDAVRSLNLSNTVCAILYEALRQNSFPNLK